MPAARPEYALAMKRPQSLVFTALVGAALTAFAAKTGMIKATVPQKAKIIGLSLNVNQRGGTHSASALDVLVGGVSILTTPFDIDALTPGTAVYKEVADLSATGLAAIAANAELSVNTTEAGGTAPTWADVTLQVDYIPV